MPNLYDKVAVGATAIWSTTYVWACPMVDWSLYIDTHDSISDIAIDGLGCVIGQYIDLNQSVKLIHIRSIVAFPWITFQDVHRIPKNPRQ